MVYVGGINQSTDKKIGLTRVDVPEYFYKIVIDTSTKEALSFIFPNSKELSDDLLQYQVSVRDVELKSSITFPIPVSKDDTPKLWDIDRNKYSKDRVKKCKK